MPPSPKRRQSLFIPIFLTLLCAGGAFWFFFIKQKAPLPPLPPAPLETPRTAPPEKSLPAPTSSTPMVTPEEPSAAEVPGGVIKEDVPPAGAPPLPGPADLSRAQETIDAFYRHLDSQEYIKSRQLDGGSKAYLNGLIDKALLNPPVVLRETDDLLTILKNSAHFFRILGKDDIFLIREILKRENDKLEELMGAYAIVLTTPADSGGNTLTTDPAGPLDDYAAYFLNTMGGKFYLSRRTPEVRMLVNFYALQAIHLANETGNNRHGIPVQPALDLLIAEFESGGNRLRHKGTYLDKLFAMKEKYQ